MRIGWNRSNDFEMRNIDTMIASSWTGGFGKKWMGAILLATAASAHAGTKPVTVVFTPEKDITLIQDAQGAWSNALGFAFFCGRTGPSGGNAILRALIKFDISSIPAGATIQSARLRMRMIQDNTGTHQVSIKRMLEDWGEGTSSATGGSGAPSTPGDATWLHRFYPDQFWSTPGGLFWPVASATIPVNAQTFYTWGPTTAMADDVTYWLANPASNFGWVLQGNETQSQTAFKWMSKDNDTFNDKPQLTVTYIPPVVTNPADLNGDGVVGPADLGILLGAWGNPGCSGARPCAADLNSDGVVGPADLGILLGNWG